jgi:hypothetical protein
MDRSIVVVGNNKPAIKILSILPLIMEEDYLVFLLADMDKMSQENKSDMQVISLTWKPRNKMVILPGGVEDISVGQRVVVTTDGNKREFNKVIDTRSLEDSWWSSPIESLDNKCPMELANFKHMHILRKHILNEMTVEGSD